MTGIQATYSAQAGLMPQLHGYYKALTALPAVQGNAEQQEEEEGKWAATKGLQYTSRGRKLSYSNKAIFQMVAPLLAWMVLVILVFGLSYKFLGDSIPRLDAVNGNARIQAYSKTQVMLLQHVVSQLSCIQV